MAFKGLRGLVPGLLYLTFITTILHSSHEGLLPFLRPRALHSLAFLPYNTLSPHLQGSLPCFIQVVAQID